MTSMQPETRNRILPLFLAAFLAAPASANVWDAVQIKGRTDHENPVSYGVGEPIVFALEAVDVPDGLDPAPFVVSWKRTGDDGRTETGTLPFAPGAFGAVTTSLDRAGFVRLEARVRNVADGKEVQRDRNAPGAPHWQPAKGVFFDGGAGVDVGSIRPEKEEPEDFDRWWDEQKSLLATVPMEATRKELPDVNGCKNYELSVACYGPQPVTGYLFVPADAEPGSCKARVAFQGYGTWKQGNPTWMARKGEIALEINAHGYELGRDQAYYDEFAKGIHPPGWGYAFSPEENARPETAYFRWMALRVLRALEYVKSLPEWNGKDLIVEGGSQGGLQSSWAAGLDPDVSLARPGITWGCDFYMTAGPSKRLKGGWHIPYAPGLDYFDAINHIRRAQCPVEITRAGLGDYTCPPSGLAAYYNAIRTPKSILWVQGSEHGLVPPEPNQTFTVSSGHEQTEAESASQSASSDVKGP